MTNKLTLILDSTQIACFGECPRMWHYEHEVFMEPSDIGEKELMNMGTYGHKLLEVYYKARSEGKTMSEASSLAEQYNIDADYTGLFHKGECKGRVLTEYQEQGINTISLLKCTKCGFICGPDDLLEKNESFPLDAAKRKEVRDRFQTYTFTYAAQDYRVADPAQVEVGFSYPLYESVDRLYVLEGKIDLYKPTLTSGQELGFVDHKFQGRRRDLYKKRVQFRNYAMVTNAVMAQVNYIRFTKKIDESTFSRPVISFAAGEHQWWREQLIATYHRIADAIANGQTMENYWTTEHSNPNWAMCEGKYNECKYTKLCEIKNPELVRITLENNYKKKEEWKPW